MLDFLFNPLLVYDPVVAVTIFGILIVVIINIFYKILINQKEAKELKERVRLLNDEMKQARKAGEMEKYKQLTGDTMKENSKLMRMTMKPMLVSFIIVIIFLPWLAAPHVYGDIFVPVDDNGFGNLTTSDNTYVIQKTNDNVKIEQLNIDCSMPCVEEIEDFDWKVHEEDKKVKFARAIVTMPFPLPIFGSYLGWLGWYIIVSIPVMVIARKLMKIYA